MNTYWVFENIRKDTTFYTELDTLLLLCSAHLWKKHHPSFTTNLCADKLTLDYLNSFNGLSVFDKTEVLPENKFVDKNIFWASAKLEKLRFINGPSIIMDHDFLVYKNLEEYLKDDLFFAHEEDGTNYYDTSWNPFIKEIEHIVKRPKPHAINCCFSYFPDSKFANHYAKTSLELMHKFTELKVPNSRFLIFAEQLLLKHLIDLYYLKYNTLLNEKWHAQDKYYVPSDKGYISFLDSNTVYRHYWMDKPKIRDSKDGFDYNEEITILYNILRKTQVNLDAIKS